VRDAFVAFLGREKIGKSQMLLEIAMRGVMENCNVAFFQAGDMGAVQQRRRMYTYLAKKSDMERYCGKLLVPIIDCSNSQRDICRKRECDTGINFAYDLKDVKFETLQNAFYEATDYKPCLNYGCQKRIPAIWFERRPEVNPLTESEARRIVYKFHRRYKKQFRLATYPNETLTISEIRSLLDTWEKEDNFIPDVIVLDYIDILAPDPDTFNLDHRHQEDKKWQRARRLSEEKHCLFITVTQSDAAGYNSRLLDMGNFSETKTKNSHVTALFGLNQTSDEKKIGLMRMNEILVREGDFDRETAVYILQRLQMGRPHLGSFFM
jgi:hypothetical protein